MVTSRLLWFQTLLAVLLLVRPPNWWDFFDRLPGKSLCEQPSGKAVVANNIAVPSVGKDALSLGNPQYTPLFSLACSVIDPNTGAEATAKRFHHCRFVSHGLHSKGGKGRILWSVDEKTVTILVSHCLKQGRCLEPHCNQKKISEVDTSGEYLDP